MEISSYQALDTAFPYCVLSAVSPFRKTQLILILQEQQRGNFDINFTAAPALLSVFPLITKNSPKMWQPAEMWLSRCCIGMIVYFTEAQIRQMVFICPNAVSISS